MTQLGIDYYKSVYVKLLDLLGRVNDLVDVSFISDASEKERLCDAHKLSAIKFFGHALTILHLSHGFVIRDLPSFRGRNFKDSASISVLTRAAMEAFLVFHYVFYAPETKEEKDYRYWAYKTGIVERQSFPALTEEFKQILSVEKEELNKLRDKLEANTIFQNLTEKQKRAILKGKWKLPSWHKIAIDAGFSNRLASQYGHLSGYAHSGRLSVIQTAQALVNKESEILIEPAISLMKILTANMIQEYSGLFPKAQDVLSKDIEGNKLVEQYIQIGSILDKYTGIGQEND